MIQSPSSCCAFQPCTMDSTTDESASVSSQEQQPSRPKLRVGCALLPKKVSRYLTKHMIDTAARQGIDLCLIDYDRSLSEQGHFDAIIHKLRPNKDWEQNLKEYSENQPQVRVIDQIDNIRTLQNRATMLSPLTGSGILIKPQQWGAGRSQPQIRVQAPHQVEIPEGMSPEEAQQRIEEAGLQPPLLVKPLWTDGREGSHGLAVLHDFQALGRLIQGAVSAELRPPLVVQQFVEHGGVLFKVYVLGMRTVVTKRPSLDDTYLGEAARTKGVLSLPRISCSAKGPNGQPACLIKPRPGHPMPELPPDWSTHALASTLRSRLGMQLFNFDLIVPEHQESDQETLYYVIDINYFPGVDKIPNFEQVFVEFLMAACTEEREDGSHKSDSSHSSASNER